MTVLNEAGRLMEAAKARVRIRDGRPGDTLALLALFYEAFDERVTNSGYTARSYGDMKLIMRASALLGKSAPVRTVVADLDGEVVAGAVAARRGPEVFYTEGVATTGEWWSEGLGTRVYERLFEVLRGAGVRRLYADIETWNAGSLRFHERLGFSRAPGFEERPVVRKVYRWVQQYRGHLGPWTPLNTARPLEPDDIPALADLFVERYGPVFMEAEGLDEETIAELTGGMARWLDRVGKSLGLAVTAKDGTGRVSGGAVASYDAGSYRLNGLVVRDGDEGVAMALLHTLLYGLQRRGVRRLVANVPPDGAWLAGVLERAGFESLYRRERLYRYGEIERSPEFEAFRYRRDL